MYEIRNDEQKRKNVSHLLEKESRDGGKRLEKCSRVNAYFRRKMKRDVIFFHKN